MSSLPTARHHTVKPPVPVIEDKTPADFRVRLDSGDERWIKRPLRRLLYPPYRAAVHAWLARSWGRQSPVRPDQWLWGHRGNDYEAHRRRVNRIYPLEGKRILVAGCGTGRDIASWLPFRPSEIVGADYFNYGRAWELFAARDDVRASDTSITFEQVDLAHETPFPDCSFDVIGSDALFEHIADLPAVLREFHRLLKPGGILYATFGPLWHCWHGDHISGYDSIRSGYNHLLLEPEEYERYVNQLGDFSHSEQDGRTWVENGLFSYLRADQYVSALDEAGFQRVYMASAIDPLAVRFLRNYPDVRGQLLATCEEIDLVIAAMTIIHRRGADEGTCES